VNANSTKSDEFCGEALQRTFHVLATTANACAETTLIAGLDSRWAEVAASAARAILVRNSASGQKAILDRWPVLGGLIAPVLMHFPGRMTAVLAQRLENPDPEQARIALRAAIDIGEYDIISKLLPALEARRSSVHLELEAALTSLTTQLFEEVHGRRSYQNRRDPQLARMRVVNELESSLGRFDRHRNSIILTCFLSLASRENSSVIRLLSQSSLGSLIQQEAVKLLRSSELPGVMRLLASFLDDSSAPLIGLQIAAQRTDAPFVEECLRRIESGDREQLSRNLKKAPQWQWLEKGPEAWASLYESEQSTAVSWCMLSNMDAGRKLNAIRWILAKGRVGARIRAAESLAEFQGEEANSLVLQHLGDTDARVRAALLSQLRERQLPGAVSRLIASLVDTDPHVRKAVQKQLPEFKFRRYLDLFDSMDPAAQQANGKIVKRVDPEWRRQLENELKAEMRLRRLRGLRIAQFMEAGAEVFQAVLPFAADEEALTRKEAIIVLGQSDAVQAVAALRQALMDPNVTVRQAAEEILKSKHLAAPGHRPNLAPSAVQV
jgi:hypothetical protein